jgi:hypothetical protein
MAFNFDPMIQAAELDCQAEARRSLAKHSRWRIVKWWHYRKAAKLEESADIWRGMGWRLDRAIEWQMEHSKHCPGKKQDEQTEEGSGGGHRHELRQECGSGEESR